MSPQPSVLALPPGELSAKLTERAQCYNQITNPATLLTPGLARCKMQIQITQGASPRCVKFKQEEIQMKNLKKVLALVLAVVMIMGVVTVASAKTYTDVKGTDNYADAIDALSSLKILDGFEDGTFKADGTLNRAQAAKIVAIVHNAATNGKIDADIADLYANAQNPFVDCNTSWALPYINYCRITGLADGMTATTYEPKREVTGVQFLKLMLTTLNFDTAKEGYTGTGWDINVLNRANEVGLTAGLAKGWKAIAPLKRGEAAQILFNALTKNLVEYGQLVKNNYVDAKKNEQGIVIKNAYYSSAFISNESVAASGYTLGGKMGITIFRTDDAFMRPGYKFVYRSWSGFYMDTPVAEYTTKTTACQLLKDFGIAETSSKGLTKEHVYQNGGQHDDLWTAYTHTTAKACANNAIGGQGVLTQAFIMPDGTIRVTEISQYLANVTAVSTTKHTAATTATLNIFGRPTATPDYFMNYTDAYAFARDFASNAFAKGDYALVKVSWKVKAAVTNEAGKVLEAAVDYSNGKVITAEKTEGKVATLNGAKGDAKADPSMTRIDGTYVADAWGFVNNYARAHYIYNNADKYTFFYDTYGNVIGCLPDSTAASYVVVDGIWSAYDAATGKYAVKADLVDFAAKKIEAVTVAEVEGFFTATTAEATVAQNKKLNDKVYNKIYTYQVNAKGAYELEYVGEDTAADGTQTAVAGIFVHNAGKAYITLKRGTTQYSSVKVSEATKFLVQKADGTYEEFTGYSALPGLTATYIDYVYPAETPFATHAVNAYAEYVYLGGVSYEGESVTGFVPSWAAHYWADGYELIAVYVNGEEKLVNVKADDVTGLYPAGGAAAAKGLYKFTTATDPETGVVYMTFVSLATPIVAQEGKYIQGQITSISNDLSAMTVASDRYYDIAITSTTKIYDATGITVDAVAAKDLEVGQTVQVVNGISDAVDGIYIVG